MLVAMEDLRDGNFRRRLVIAGDGVPGRIAAAFNEIAQRNQELVGELARVRAEATQGRLGVRLALPGASGGWAFAEDSVNGLVESTMRPTTELSRVLAAAAEGDLSLRMSVPGDSRYREFRGLATTVNGLLDQLSAFAAEVTRVAREVGSEGRLGGQAQVPGAAGTWKDLTDNVNIMAENLTAQVRNIAQVTTAVARGDLSQKINVDARGEILELKSTINTMVDQLSAFADEVTRVAREVGSEGRLGGQAQVPGAAGTWKDLTDNVNIMAENLTAQVRNIAQVTTAVARGDLSQKINVDARGEILELKATINTMVDQLSAFADEVTRVAREVGTDGKLGGQARVRGVDGTWKDLTDNVNIMAENLTNQVRSIATVATAVADGNLSKKIMVAAKGEVAALTDTINEMVDTLGAFAAEVTRVAREVGTEGILGGQARVPGGAGTWKDLTDNVNSMAQNLTSQVRNIAQVTTAVARGDLSKKIDVDARGEILELKTTINTMVDQLSAFAAEVTRVAREVGTEGKLGGQAEVLDVSGTWHRLTESVNHLAGNLTTQVRAIAAVATAVTMGDLTRQITVDASGEVADLKDNINQMIANLKETTHANQEQDWLKTNLARISGLMQGHRDLAALTSLIMSELAPLVSAQHGTFFLAVTDGPDGPVTLERTASYGAQPGSDSPTRFRLGESLIGQAARDKKTIMMAGGPPGYIKISSSLGSADPVNVIVLPVLFEGEVLGVIELSSVHEFGGVYRDLLEQLKETIGVNVNTILATSRTEGLLTESQRLAQELRAQREELQRSNTELAEKAELLAQQNRDIEAKNIKIEQASQLEERARQIALASKYKSEFLANMSHELRTPLNSVLIMAKLLADNLDGNLSTKQVELAKTIYRAGNDLLQLINNVLDLAKIEAGRMEVLPVPVELTELVDYIESLHRPLAAEKALDFTVVIEPNVPASLETDKYRLQQILRNLLSNAVKFTHTGGVALRIRLADKSEVTRSSLRSAGRWIAFDVEDSGIGIPADKLSLVFEAFQQADGTTSRTYGGSGLGLSITRELTRLLGGELQVHSEPDNGSTFTLYLPTDTSTAMLATGPAPVLQAPSEPDEAIASTSDEPAEPPTEAMEEAPAELPTTKQVKRFHGEKVLIVDDDTRNTLALATLLEAHGLQVAQADSGIAALRALERTGDIALVLMDVMMPELDGNTTTARIRKMPEYCDLPIIAVTAKAMNGDRDRSLACGATDYVTKPVDVNHLLHLIARHLG
ncbi:HAMP domain-containing protein [Dactylosporangium sp. NBC_01737]|nr:HAMP domain-containing protein [Dactylosporangium sp. NBC_01737]